MEKDIIKYKALKTKEELVTWANEPEGATKIVSVTKDVTNGDWVIWYTAPPKLVWQFKTPINGNRWNDATDDEYNAGKDLSKYQWRQIEK